MLSVPCRKDEMILPWLISFLFLISIPVWVSPSWAEENGKQRSTRYGIAGQMAPELNLSNWIDAAGKATASVRLADLRGKVVYLYFFQDWCPGCHSHGFPTLQALQNEFAGDQEIQLLAVQTAFEGRVFNTESKLRKNQTKYDLKIPMAHDGGRGGKHGLPMTMANYRTGGTPWTVIINKEGQVVFNDYHIDLERAIWALKELKK